MEVVGTAIFVSLIMSIKYYTASNESILGAFTVGLTLYGVIMMIGSKTGGCLNPAVGIVQSVFQNILHSQYSNGPQNTASIPLEDLPQNSAINVINKGAMLIYIFGPLLGGIIAGLFGAMNDSIHKVVEHGDKNTLVMIE